MNDEIKRLKEKVPESGTKEMDKTIFKIYHVFDDNDIEYGTLINYIYDINKYEVYIFISNKEFAVPCIGLYFVDKKEDAISKFENYKKIVNEKNLKMLEALIQ